MNRHGLWRRLPGRLGRLTRGEIEHIVFWTGILLKTADAVLEVVGGIALLFISAQTINNVVHGLVQPELAEDPGDLLARYILKLMGHVSPTSKMFAVVYLLVHGAVKLVIVGTIWLRQLWGYPLAGAVFSAFAVYQMVRFAYTYSIMMILLTVLDVIIIALLWPEYHRLKLEIRLSGRHGRHRL